MVGDDDLKSWEFTDFLNVGMMHLYNGKIGCSKHTAIFPCAILFPRYGGTLWVDTMVLTSSVRCVA